MSQNAAKTSICLKLPILPIFQGKIRVSESLTVKREILLSAWQKISVKIVKRGRSMESRHQRHAICGRNTRRLVSSYLGTSTQSAHHKGRGSSSGAKCNDMGDAIRDAWQIHLADYSDEAE